MAGHSFGDRHTTLAAPKQQHAAALSIPCQQQSYHPSIPPQTLSTTVLAGRQASHLQLTQDPHHPRPAACCDDNPWSVGSRLCFSRLFADSAGGCAWLRPRCRPRHDHAARARAQPLCWRHASWRSFAPMSSTRAGCASAAACSARCGDLGSIQPTPIK